MDPELILGIPGITDAEELGRGGFGTVHRAQEPEFGRTVAVKVLRAHLDDDAARRAFARECRAMGVLSGHPHIATVHRGGETADGYPYIVMDLMSGGSLADRIDPSLEGEVMPWREVLHVGVQLAGALETAHRHGVLHLDLKPANVLVSRYGEPKLADFGISRFAGSPETSLGGVRASPAFSAPERLAEGVASVAVDLYGLGATLFTLLTGAPAFVDGEPEQLIVLLARIARDPLPDLRPRGIPDALCRVVERLMAKNPGDRYASAADAAAALQNAQRATGQPVTRAVIEGAPTEAEEAAAPTSLTIDVVRPARAPRGAVDGPPPNGAGIAGSHGSGPHSGGAHSGGPHGTAIPPPRSASGYGGPSVGEPGGSGPGGSGPPVPWAAATAGPASGWPPPGAPWAGASAATPSAPVRSGRRRGLVVGLGALVVVVVLLVVVAVMFATDSGPFAGPGTPTSDVVTPSTQPPTTTVEPTRSVTLADGVVDERADEAAAVLDAYVTAINAGRHADAYALLSPDSDAAADGYDAWAEGQSTTQITDARITSVTDAPDSPGDVQAEMAFRSEQAAEYGFEGQTCTLWDLAYTLEGPDLLIGAARTVNPPREC